MWVTRGTGPGGKVGGADHFPTPKCNLNLPTEEQELLQHSLLPKTKTALIPLKPLKIFLYQIMGWGGTGFVVTTFGFTLVGHSFQPFIKS